MPKKDPPSSGRPSNPRAGVYRRQPTGYWAFIPAEVPPHPPVSLNNLEPELSNANLALGKLEGIGVVVPDPDLFVRMYGRKEAVLSSQIEGTQASLSDLLADEATPGGRSPKMLLDVREVRNHVRALEAGQARLAELPLSLRLIREMHGVLLEGVRGDKRTPGEFRRSQNWIGREGGFLRDAAYVPPPPEEMTASLSNLEKFLRAEDNLPVLVRAGIAHAQFETIHPFLDGNGRIGRLLVTFLLLERKVLSRPLLYLSMFFKEHRQEYYRQLMLVREDGDWEIWLKFFLRGVHVVADEAVRTVKRVLDLMQRDRAVIQAALPHRPNALRLLQHLSRSPVLTVQSAAGSLGVTEPTANALVADLERLGLLKELTGGQRNRVFEYAEYLHVLTPGESRS